jgi:hypothetical protein
VTTDTKQPEPGPRGGRGVGRFLKNVLLFLASPFIALSYLVALPVFGLYQFIKAARDKKDTAA